MKRAARFASQAVAALVLLTAQAPAPAGAPVPVDIPAGFGVRPTGTREAVIHAQVVAQSPNPIDRASIEAQCDVARGMGLTTRHPAFEPGHDRPIKTETLRFGNAQHRADFVTRHAYECELPARTTRSADMLCGCTYRLRVHRSVHVDVNAGRGSAPAKDLDKVRQLAPEVLRPGNVAGVPCVWRRQRLSGDGRIDRCIVEDDSLPALLHGRALAETMSGGDPPVIHSTSTATQIILDATVDTGVFDVAPSDATKARTP